MRQQREEALAKILQILEIRFADFAEEKTFQAGEALAIVSAHLGQEPVGFPAAARAAVADGLGTVGLIAATCGGAGGQLRGQEHQAGVREVEELVLGAPLLLAELKELRQPGLRSWGQ